MLLKAKRIALNVWKKTQTPREIATPSLIVLSCLTILFPIFKFVTNPERSFVENKVISAQITEIMNQGSFRTDSGLLIQPTDIKKYTFVCRFFYGEPEITTVAGLKVSGPSQSCSSYAPFNSFSIVKSNTGYIVETDKMEFTQPFSPELSVNLLRGVEEGMSLVSYEMAKKASWIAAEKADSSAQKN
jgi:hypothetical protein